MYTIVLGNGASSVFFMQNISVLPLQRALVIQAINPCWGGVHNCSQFQNRKSLVFASMSSLHQVWKITDLKEICTSAKIIKNYIFVVYSLVEKKLQIPKNLIEKCHLCLIVFVARLNSHLWLIAFLQGPCWN